MELLKLVGISDGHRNGMQWLRALKRQTKVVSLRMVVMLALRRPEQSITSRAIRRAWYSGFVEYVVPV